MRFHHQALRVLMPLCVALAVLTIFNPASLLLVALTAAAGGLTVLLQWTEREIAAWEDEPENE